MTWSGKPATAHPAVITTSADGTARIWDPHRAKELMGVPVFGTRLSKDRP
jgi:hypothetical protein